MRRGSLIRILATWDDFRRQMPKFRVGTEARKKCEWRKNSPKRYVALRNFPSRFLAAPLVLFGTNWPESADRGVLAFAAGLPFS